MNALAQLTLDDATSSAAVLRLYRQGFSVLAGQAEAMLVDPASLDIDEAILDAFAEAGSDGPTVEQRSVECRHLPAQQVERRFQVLRDYGAISRAFERANERRYRAAFAPFVMMLFLRRLSAQGGQSEVHRGGPHPAGAGRHAGRPGEPGATRCAMRTALGRHGRGRPRHVLTQHEPDRFRSAEDWAREACSSWRVSSTAASARLRTSTSRAKCASTPRVVPDTARPRSTGGTRSRV